MQSTEHLPFQVADPLPFLGSIRNAGAILSGFTHRSPVGIMFSTDHVLPTAGFARQTGLDGTSLL